VSSGSLQLLLITNKKQASIDLIKAAAQKGWAVHNAPKVELIKEAVMAVKEYTAVLIDAPIEISKSSGFVNFIRSSFPQYTMIYVPKKFLEPATQVELVNSGVINELPCPLEDTAKIISELEERLDPKKAGFYDINMLNCFIQATNDVMTYYTGELPKIGKPSIRKGRSLSTEYLTGLTHIEGPNITGSAAMCCDQNFIGLMASRIGGHPRGTFDEGVVVGTAQDLIDQIFGKSGQYLEGIGLNFGITVPDIMLGKGHAINHRGKSPVMGLDFTLGKRTFSIEFSIDRTEGQKDFLVIPDAGAS